MDNPKSPKACSRSKRVNGHEARDNCNHQEKDIEARGSWAMLSRSHHDPVTNERQQCSNSSSNANDHRARTGFSGWRWLLGQKDRTGHPSTVPIERRECTTDQAASGCKQEHFIEAGPENPSPHLVSNSATNQEPQCELEAPCEPLDERACRLGLKPLLNKTSCSLFSHSMSRECFAQQGGRETWPSSRLG
jgi:hypothetical protein